MAKEKGNIGNFSVIGTVDGIEFVDGKSYSFVLFHTRSNEKNKIEHRMFTGCEVVSNLSAGDLVEFYCRLTASPYQGKVYYNPEVKAFHIIKKNESSVKKQDVEQIKPSEDDEDIPF